MSKIPFGDVYVGGERGARGTPEGLFVKSPSGLPKNFKKGFISVYSSFWESKTLFSKRVLAAGGRSPALRFLNNTSPDRVWG
jgi:hypothetical protein